MIMKRLLLICICILSCIFCFTKEVHIKLTKNDQMADTRSSPAILITQENNIIYIYTDSPIQNIKITVKDETGNLVYSEYITNIYNRYPIFINNAESGIYMINLTINYTFQYYGIFDINE